MDLSTVLQYAGSAITAGSAALLGFRQRLKSLEVSHKKLRQDHESLKAGFRLELDTLKDEIKEKQETQRRVDDAVARERASRPDPVADLRTNVDQLHAQFTKLQERSARYVRNDAFTSFVKGQEEQWREMQRTLGRLEGMLK